MQDARNELWTVRLGLIDYGEALALQHEVHAARVRGDIPDVLLTLEHPPIYTKGRRSTPDELPMGEDWYRAQGIELRDVDRGGKVTYHGPGQLVAYPIVSTQLFGGDVTALVCAIEGAMIDALAGEGIPAHRDDAGRGVWAGEGPAAGKIGSVGLHIAQGVTTHGLMVNVDNDLQPFSWIRPCGLDDPATSIAKIAGRSGQLRCFEKRVAFATAERFGLRQRIVSRAKLHVRVHDLVLAP
ncbi:MAG: lipoyl(octanoyl) transferase LipB [Thermoleophilaceae bacterium]|nr:lipoyl(octanoyl) transferase LipB [Thermoleophilaceae bacterium]